MLAAAAAAASPSSSWQWQVHLPVSPNFSLSSSSYSSICCYSSSSTTSPLKSAAAAEPKSAKSKPPPSPSPTPTPAAPNSNSNNEEDEPTTKSISQIQVPREKYIPVSKSQLLDSLLSYLRSQSQSQSQSLAAANHDDDDDDDDDSTISHFLLLSSCLDSILHAEHKAILEEMRADYFAAHSLTSEEAEAEAETETETETETDTDTLKEVGRADTLKGRDNGGVKSSTTSSADDTLELEDNQMPFLNGLDLFQLFGSADSRDIDQKSRHHELTVQCFGSSYCGSFPALFHEASSECAV